MAIKPSDTVIWLDKAGYFDDAPDWNGYWRPLYHYPKYWTNFIAHAVKDVPGTHVVPLGLSQADRKKAVKEFKERPKRQDQAIKQLLDTYNAEWKICKQGEYLKFKDPAQMTLFMLRFN